MSRTGRVVVTPPPRWPLPDIGHVWEAREVFSRFAARDVTLRYRQTALGIVWVVLQPLLTALVFALVFGRVAKLPSGGVPYLVFSFAGLLAWNVFSGVLTRAAPSLVTNAGLVSKVYFPRILVPLSTAGSVLVDFGVSLVFMIVLLVVYGVSPGWGVLLLPIWLLLLVCLAAGLSVVCAALMVRYRDVQYVVPFLLQFLLYASPIAYATSAVPARYRVVYDINPLSWSLQEFRFSLLHAPCPPAWQIIASVLVAAGVLFLGTMYFEHEERGFADYI